MGALVRCNEYVICDFKTGRFYVRHVRGMAQMSKSAYKARRYIYRATARAMADALNAEFSIMDCDVISPTAAWAIEIIKAREALPK